MTFNSDPPASTSIPRRGPLCQRVWFVWCWEGSLGLCAYEPIIVPTQLQSEVLEKFLFWILRPWERHRDEPAKSIHTSSPGRQSCSLPSLTQWLPSWFPPFMSKRGWKAVLSPLLQQRTLWLCSFMNLSLPCTQWCGLHYLKPTVIVFHLFLGLCAGSRGDQLHNITLEEKTLSRWFVCQLLKHTQMPSCPTPTLKYVWKHKILKRIGQYIFFFRLAEHSCIERVSVSRVPFSRQVNPFA